MTIDQPDMVTKILGRLAIPRSLRASLPRASFRDSSTLFAAYANSRRGELQVAAEDDPTSSPRAIPATRASIQSASNGETVDELGPIPSSMTAHRKPGIKSDINIHLSPPVLYRTTQLEILLQGTIAEQPYAAIPQ